MKQGLYIDGRLDDVANSKEELKELLINAYKKYPDSEIVVASYNC